MGDLIKDTLLKRQRRKKPSTHIDSNPYLSVKGPLIYCCATTAALV